MSLSRTDQSECGIDWTEKRQNDVKNLNAKKKKKTPNPNEPPVAFAFWLSVAIRGRNTSTRCTHHTFFSTQILLITRRKEGDEVHFHSEDECGRED